MTTPPHHAFPLESGADPDQPHMALYDIHDELRRAARALRPGRELHWAERVSRGLQQTRAAIAGNRGDLAADDGLCEHVRTESQWLVPECTCLMGLHARVEASVTELTTSLSSLQQGDTEAARIARTQLRGTLRTIKELLASEYDIAATQFNEPPALD